ncbi:MAG: hypothetical protein D4R88_01655 [Methanosarcinales archaeon]|nr:MAG: hypothetical protein D4R88_01655 [Methanosarcinales archaeon]
MAINLAVNTIRKTGHTAAIIASLFLASLLCIPFALAAAGSHDANGGVITNIEIVSYSQTAHWQGYYGLITTGNSPTYSNYFNISGASIGTIRSLELGAIIQQDDVILITSSGSPPSLSELQKGDLSLIDSITGTGTDSGTNTFTSISNYTIPCSGNNITNVPTAYTFVNSTPQYQDFKEGLLKDRSGNPVFIVPLNVASKSGFDNTSYYFQFMVPNNYTNLQNYYMYYVPSCTGGALHVNILSPENRTYFKNETSSLNIPVTVYANRTISVFNYSLDNGAQKSFINGTTTINPDFGLHNIIVYLKDTAGIWGTDTQYFRVSNPVITGCYPDRYFAISNISNVIYRINATGSLNKTLYINITAPNGSFSAFNLSNVSDVFYYTPYSEGRYNVTFNANYSECTSYFWSLQNLFPMTIKVLEINESKGAAGINVTARWYWPGTFDVINPVDYQETFYGNTTFNYTNATGYSNIFPDVEFTQYSGSLVVRLNSLNLSTAVNEFYHDFVENPPGGFLLTYGIHTTIKFTNANLYINYSNTGYSNEDDLELYKCDNWDYANAACLSSWVKRTDAEQNKQRHLFNITVTNFSGFSIRSKSSAHRTNGEGSSGYTPSPTITPTVGKETGTGEISGSMLPASQEDVIQKCERCNLFGLNYGWWILCWYWWVLIFAILLRIIVHLALKLLYKKASCLLCMIELIHPVSLAVKIRDNKDPLSGYLREQFSEETLQLLNGYDDSTRPSKTIKKALVDELNRLLQGDCLYNEQRFTHVTLKDETRRLISQNPEGNELICLNRLLLKDAYPYEIVNMRKNLYETFKLRYWIPVVIILLVPLSGFIGLIASPINWVTGIVAELIYIIYLIFKLRIHEKKSTKHRDV